MSLAKHIFNRKPKYTLQGPSSKLHLMLNHCCNISSLNDDIIEILNKVSHIFEEFDGDII